MTLRPDEWNMMDLALCLRDAPVADAVRAARFAEEHGYRELWLPDGAHGGQVATDGRSTGRDAFAVLATVFAATSTLGGGIGVAAVPMYQPPSLALIAATLAEASGGRFSLGLGVSHPELTARHGVAFPQRPVEHVRAWVRDLRERSARGLAFGGGWPVLVAALGPRMVRLAAEEADGLVLNWLSPEHAARVVRSVRDARPPGAAPARTVLYLRLMPADAARRDAAGYDALANYHRHFAAQGLSTVDEVAAATTLPSGDLGAVRDRLAAYAEAGIDLACVYPIGLDRDTGERLLTALAAG